MSRGTQDAASSPVSFRLHGYHILWPRFPAGSPNCRFDNSTYAVLQPPGINTGVWAVPISLAATFGISVIYFPAGTEMVHFPGLAHTRLCIQRAVTRVHLVGFLHSDIPGSKPACGSPRLFAACHVLHRLLAPRHPPYALSSLIIKLTQTVASPNRIAPIPGFAPLPIPAAPYFLNRLRVETLSEGGFRLRSLRFKFSAISFSSHFWSLNPIASNLL